MSSSSVSPVRTGRTFGAQDEPRGNGQTDARGVFSADERPGRASGAIPMNKRPSP
jgi:hypothetical protein